MIDIEQQPIDVWVDRTLKRLQEISASSQEPKEKRLRASVDVCLLLQEIAATCLSESVQAGVNQTVALYMNLEGLESQGAD